MIVILQIINVFGIFVICTSPNSRKRGYVDGDIILGALFSIHEQPTLGKSYSRECGKIRETYGMHRVEVLLKTIEEINKDPEILPGIKLGVDIRDTCWYVPIALEQSIDFIKNSLAHQERTQKILQNSNTSVADLLETPPSSGKAIAGLVGPGASTVTVQVQNLLQLFKIPQISYSATAADLSKKEEYKYFLRVVPSDILQTQALADLIDHYKWEYVSLVNTQGPYGSQGIKELVNIIKNKNICTDQVIEIDNNEEFTKVVDKARKLFEKDRAKVVICFCQGETVKQLFEAMIKLNKTNQGHLIIGTDGWADRTDILGRIINTQNGERELSRAAFGGISIRLHSLPIQGFDSFFRSKNYSNSNGNPWFQEFWEQTFNCSVMLQPDSIYKRKCQGNESLYNVDYVQDSKLGFVVKSVMTVAHGLHNLHKKLCKTIDKKCEKFYLLNGTALLQEMLNVSFRAYDDEIVRFDSKGDPPGRYDIMNYQIQVDGISKRPVFKYQRIGTWRDKHLVIDSEVQWPGSPSNMTIKSYCSKPCKANAIREISGNKRCCWQCKMCKKNEFKKVNTSEERCVECPQGHLPNKNITGCVKIISSYILWGDVTSIIAVIFSCIGTLATVVVIVIFAKYNHTPVVKSSTRELMYVILVGIIMCYLTTFPLLSKPSFVSCLMTRIMPGLSFSLIFGALVTKTNRICRILATSKKKIIRHKGRFLTTTAQIVITFILNLIETLIISIVIFLEPPAPVETFPSFDRAQLICNYSDKSVFIPFGFDAILVCLCTWYAFKTRNLPENFNEAKYIGFTMYTTCIIWIGLVPIYFGAEYQVVSMCFAINLSATTALFLLFIPKVYIIIWKPQRNERSAFTTTTDIRCHIGPGKVEHQNSKEKLQKIQMGQNIFRDRSRSSVYTTNPIEFSCNNCISKVEFTHHSPIRTDNKLIQTESILILDYLPQTPNNPLSIPDDISLTQMALLQFLDENWDNNYIPITDIKNPAQSRLRCTDLDRIQCTDTEDEEEDRVSMKMPMLAGQATSASTCSPISNVSADASSTISTMFLEYLKAQGRKFSNYNESVSVKL